MAAEYTQKPETVPNDSQITSGNSIEDEKNVKTEPPIRGIVFPLKKEETDAKQPVKTDVESGLVNHADSNSSPVHSESMVSKTKTEEVEEPVVSSKLQMEWSDTEEDLDQCLSRICENNETNGAVTPETKQENVTTESGTILKEAKEPNLQDGETVITKDEDKELPDEQPAASEETAEKENDKEKLEGGEEKQKGQEEATGDAEQKEEKEVVKKPPRKTPRLECRDCGKCFTRRETYNLHRHFHAHQDEQASLTCKECGLTFQHRSSLIKHRNEHKAVAEKASLSEKAAVSGKTSLSEKALVSPAKRSKRSGSSETEKENQCEHCSKTFETLAKLRMHSCKRAPEKPYRCPLCRKEFQYRVSITAHMQTHSLEFRFRCLECNKGFQSPMALRIHERSHAALKPYSCPECGMVFRHRSVMEDHRRRHTEERPFYCITCGKYFRFASLLHQHQYLHTGRKPFRCRECGKRFAFSQNLRVHNRQHQKHPHCCPHCLDTFSDEATLQAHIAKHEKSITNKENTHYGLGQSRLYNCPLCSQVYYRPADLRVHMLVHEAAFEGLSNGLKELRPTFPCSRCHLTFLDEASLKAHAVTHEPPTFTKKDAQGPGVVRKESVPGSGIYADQIDKKPLRCEDCGRGFHHRSVLELHMRIHSKDKPYRCNVCGKSFKFNTYLQQHVIIHTGKKPYKCPDCGKDFAFYQNMRTHHKLHQEKPFRCTQCRKGYSDEAQLQTHMLTHKGDRPHKCTVCDKSFNQVYLLRDHMNTHTGERPHRCTDCGKAFQWLSSLLVHQKIHVRKPAPYSHANSSEGPRREGGAGAPTATESLRSDWPRWDGAQRTPPNTYAATGSQVPEWQDRVSQQQQQQQLQSFRHQSESQELSVQPPGISANQPSPWKQDKPREQQRPAETAPAKPVLQIHQPQPQRPAERQTQAVQNVGWISMMSQQSTQQAQQHVQSEAGSHLVQPQSTSRTDPSLSVMFTRPQPPPPEEDALPWATKASPALPHSQSPLKVAGAEHNSQISPPSVFWGSTGASVPHTASLIPGSPNLSTRDQPSKGVTSVQTTQPGLSSLPPMEDPKLWSTVEKLPPPQQSPGLSNQPLSLNQSPVMDPSRIPPPGPDNTLWTFQTTSAIPKALGPPDLSSSAVDQLPQQLLHLQQQKLQLQHQQQQLQLQQQQQMQQQQQLQLQQQQLQQLQMQQQQQLQLQQQQLQLQQQQQQQKQAWVTSPTSNPVAIQYGPPRFSHADSSPAVWGFQASPAGSQTLITAPMQQGTVQAQTQLPLMAGPQIIMNQSPTFLSPALRPLPPLGLPPPHPLHSVAVNQIPRPAPPPQNIFFSPQGIMGDRPTLTQTSPFSSLPPSRTELPNLTGRLPFSSDRRQCVVCGCTFSQEVELQMHYMQHAKGEI